MTVLEIAEQFAKGPQKPKRSILFVWHTGEERGSGSELLYRVSDGPRDSM
jgi:Zn-dependent M28 family amino/carboxypeptidase